MGLLEARTGRIRWSPVASTGHGSPGLRWVLPAPRASDDTVRAMATDPLHGVALDETWVQSFERIEGAWAAQSRGLATLERLSTGRVEVRSVVPVPAADGSCAALRVTFDDESMVSMWGVGAADAAAFVELSRIPGTHVVVWGSPEATVNGWRVRLRLHAPDLGPVVLGLDATTLS